MEKYEIISVSAYGHSPADCCAEYGCRCIVESDDEDAEEGTTSHDECECECGFEVDNLHRAGSIEAPDDATDEQLFDAMTEEGCFKRGVKMDALEFESSDGYLVEVNDAKTGEPLYQLRLIDGEPLYHPRRIEEQPAPPPPLPPLDGQVEASEIGPEALAQMREKGGDWYAYRNVDLGDSNVGHLQFLKCGHGCTHETPPRTTPDTSVGLGWRYTLEGKVDLRTGLITK